VTKHGGYIMFQNSHFIRLSFIFFTLLIIFASNKAHSAITYQWVPDAGSGGSGYIRFDEAFIATSSDDENYVYTDEANFTTYFGNPPVLEIFFEFDNGFTIDTATGFSTATSIQSDLSSTQFSANSGIFRGLIGDFIFDYSSITKAGHTYDGVVVDQIFCVRLPCPQGGLEVNFSGILSAETNIGEFQLVPIPGAVWLFISGLFSIAGLAKYKHTI